jgi:hypothetical protein
MLILGRDRLADPTKGYAKTFLRQMEQALGVAMDRGVRIVTNAGGSTRPAWPTRCATWPSGSP